MISAASSRRGIATAGIVVSRGDYAKASAARSRNMCQGVLGAAQHATRMGPPVPFAG